MKKITNRLIRATLAIVAILRLVTIGTPALALNEQQINNIPNRPIPVRFLYDISTEGLEQGNAIPLEITQDIYINGKKLFNQGGAGYAVIDELKKARFFGRGGKIKISHGELTAIDGRRFPILLSATQEGAYKLSSASGALIGSSVAFSTLEGASKLGTASGWIFGLGTALVPIAFFMSKGKEAKISRGKIMFASLIGPGVM